MTGHMAGHEADTGAGRACRGQFRLGITGGIGSGKSHVARMLEERWGVPVYDCDREAKRITAESRVVRQALVSLVGDGLVRDGVMQKQALAAYLFASPDHAARVNAIIHPHVRADFLRWADSHSASPVVAIESAILCESGFHTLVDAVMLVEAPVDVRLRRAMARDGATREQVLARMARQDSAQARRLARFIVRNDGCGDGTLQAQLEQAMRALQAEAHTHQGNNRQTNP